MNDKTLIKICFILTAMISFSKGQCPPPPSLANGGYIEIVTGKLAAYYCNTNYTFSTNDSVITSDCVRTSWTAVNAQCRSSGPATTCPSTNPNPPKNATEVVFSTSTNLMKAYKCLNDLQWLSGQPARISQCINETWTTILDICDIACQIPRHCGDVSELGLSGTGDFYVVPSGQPYGQVFLVHCELDSTADNNGGNWTYIFKTDVATDFSNDLIDYLNGISISNYTTAVHYFIGLYYLSNVSLPLPDDTVGMTLEVLFYDSSHTLVSYATYNNFTVGDVSTSYSITSLGKYHGIAGDALCPQLGTKFNFGTTSTTPAAMWWRALFSEIDTTVAEYNGSFLTSKGTWKTLDASIKRSVSTVIMRIRPTVDDNAEVCPPMVGTEFWWQSTNASIPYSRSPGTNITWQCFGDYIMEGVEGGKRTHDGISTCLNTTTPPQWSYNITLPCTLSCPDGFGESDDARVCFNYSTDIAVSIMDAAKKCSAKGAYLSVIVNQTDFSLSDNRTGYYTAFAARGSNASQLVPPLPATVLDNCTETSVCTPNKTNQCTVIQAPDQYKYVSCLESHNYLCQLQKYCPDSTYQPIGGRCLKIFSEPTSLSAASTACAAEGASLVYPTTIAEAGNITSFLLQKDSSTNGSPKSYFIGTNNFNGDWTAGGLFVMSDLLPFLATDPVNFWRTMTVYPNNTFSFTPIDINAVIPNTTAVCSLFGPLGCSEYCPAPAANMYIVNASGNTTDLGSTVSYKCYPGYFFDNITIDVVNSTCNSLLGGSTGWVPFIITDCTPLEVCGNSTLTVQSTLLSNNSVNPDSFYLNATTTFTCPPDMGYITNATDMNTTCQGNTTAGYVYNPAVIPACNACIAAITVGNATTNWTSTSGTFVTINQTVSATCVTGYEVTFGVTVQNITCSKAGWNLTNITNCSLGCVNPPPVIVTTDNVTAPNVTDNKIGTVLAYSCTPGYSFLVSTNYTAVTNQVTVTCDESGNWVPSRTPLQCDQLCTSDPPPAPAGAKSDWDGFSRNSSKKVVYTANAGTFFGNFSSTWTIICNGFVWLPIDNSSTSPTGNGQMFTVKRACMLDPVNTIGGALPVNWTSTSRSFTGQTLTYACPDGQFTTIGSNSTTITCSNATANWTVPQTDFQCKNACQGEPPPAITPATYNYVGNFTEGVVVTYHCTGGFIGGLGTVLTNNCTNGNWTMYTVPNCLTVTTPKPTTTPPYIFETGHTYPETTTSVFENIQNFQPANNGTPGYTLVSSLVGFGYAVQLNSTRTECMVQPAYSDPTKACASNPKICPNGFSLSVWAQTFFNYNDTVDFEDPTEADNRYFFSTGGDETGYPGVVIGVRKIWLFALVSTGDRYWEVSVLGPINNDTWNNIGITFNSTGLSVYINSTRVGSTTTSVSITAKPGFSPPLLMVGCSKTPASSDYFGYCNAVLDEVAFWNAPLNNTSIENFMGGFSSNVSSISPVEFAGLITTVLLDDPKQQAAAVSILQQMSMPDPSPTAAASVSSTASTGLTSTSATFAVDQGSVTKLQTMAAITMSMLDLNKVPTNITADQCDSFLNIANPISNLLDPANTGKWLHIYNKTENLGVMQTISAFSKWQAKLVQAIAYGNNSKPTCGENILPFLYYKYCKMTIADLRAMTNGNNMISLPNYAQAVGQQLRTKWKETLTDRVAFPTSIFDDDRCSHRPVTFIFNYYNTDSKSIATTVNPMNLDPSAISETDSRLMYVNLVVDPPLDSTGSPDPSQPLCEFDSELLRKTPIRLSESHMLNVEQLVKLRKLMGLYQNVSNSIVQQRFCVFWNENLTDYGAWDNNGCVMVATSAESSKCACSNFGIFSIMAVKTPPKIVPPVPAWLSAPRYVLYLLSIVALGLYIIVVMLSGDLKEQFHLIGLNLAIAILVGSLAMMFSELNAITTNRDMCTLFGTLIHLFYGAVGAWMLVLGHSSFKAITTGVIGGMLGSYMLLCWGIAIAFVGVPFLWLLADMGTDPRCFIGWPNEVKWVFFVLQITYVIVAMFFAVVVFCNLSTPALRKDNLIEDYCSFCRGAALLIVYLSATWLFGMFTYIRFPFAQINFYPLFQVLNSLSGICLFVFIGLGSNRFRSVLTRKTQERREKLRKFAFGYQEDEHRPKFEFVRTGKNTSALNLVPPTLNDKEE